MTARRSTESYPGSWRRAATRRELEKVGIRVWGKYFRDEVNARIRFNHRGQLAMANENRPDTNRAQFFFTLDACEWLKWEAYDLWDGGRRYGV